MGFEVGGIVGFGVEEFEGRGLTWGNSCVCGVDKEGDVNPLFCTGKCDVELAHFFGFLVL